MARPLTRALACGAAAAVLAVPVLTATPAAAAETEYAGATGAFALRLQVNLPDALAPLAIDLQIDPVTGTVSTTDGKASATGQVLGSSKGLLKTILDAATPLKGISSADQSNPGPNANDPLGIIPDALSAILDLGLIQSSSQVADGKSVSTASVASLKLALGDTLAEAAGPIIDALDTLQGTAINAVSSALQLPIATVCSTVTPILPGVLAPLGLSNAVLNTLCGLPAVLDGLSDDVGDSLQTLGDNIFNTGIIQTSQSIGTENGKLVSSASASIAGLGLLGTGPLGTAGVIQSSATAAANGKAGGATAEAVPPVVFDLNVGGLDGLTNLQATLTGLIGNLSPGGTLTAPLTTIIQQLLATVNSLTAPLGASVVALDDSNSAVALTSCPTALTGLQKGEYVNPNGQCAAAATRGIGVEVTLPTAISGPLGITGPFVTLALSPSSAVAQASLVTAPTATPTTPVAIPDNPDGPPEETPLPRTGLEGGLLGGAALAALLGAAYLRRSRGSLV